MMSVCRMLIAIVYFLVALVVIWAAWIGFTFLFIWLNVGLPPYVTGTIFGAEIMADWFTTVKMLRARVGIREANPIHALAIAKLGYTGDFAILVAILAVIFVFLWHGVSQAAQLGVCCVYPLIYLNNGLWYCWRLKRTRRDRERAERYAEIGSVGGDRETSRQA